MDLSNQTIPANSVKVWDPLIRIFHWSLVGFILVAFLTEDDWLYLHSFAGYSIAGLLIFRILWGLIGTQHARFSSFVTGPETVIDYLKSLLRGKPKHYLGHNPAGGVMILLMLAFLLLSVLTGVLTLATEGLGPLANTFAAGLPGHFLEEVHEALANLMLVLIFVHVAGVIVSSVAHHENLIRAMFNARKRRHPAQHP